MPDLALAKSINLPCHLIVATYQSSAVIVPPPTRRRPNSLALKGKALVECARRRGRSGGKKEPAQEGRTRIWAQVA